MHPKNNLSKSARAMGKFYRLTIFTAPDHAEQAQFPRFRDAMICKSCSADRL
jgi:hypothetical protein